jgi:hypothetical protein
MNLTEAWQWRAESVAVLKNKKSSPNPSDGMEELFSLAACRGSFLLAAKRGT